MRLRTAIWLGASSTGQEGRSHETSGAFVSGRRLLFHHRRHRAGSMPHLTGHRTLAVGGAIEECGTEPFVCWRNTDHHEQQRACFRWSVSTAGRSWRARSGSWLSTPPAMPRRMLLWLRFAVPPASHDRHRSAHPPVTIVCERRCRWARSWLPLTVRWMAWPPPKPSTGWACMGATPLVATRPGCSRSWPASPARRCLSCCWWRRACRTWQGSVPMRSSSASSSRCRWA
jgi:hypothetical protein